MRQRPDEKAGHVQQSYEQISIRAVGKALIKHASGYKYIQS
jgi:hypothetical protein